VVNLVNYIIECVLLSDVRVLEITYYVIFSYGDM
jgi:hypothetical protein